MNVPKVQIEQGPQEGRLYDGRQMFAINEVARHLSYRHLIESLKIWYDPKEDFYHCEGVYNGVKFDVRYYKGFAIDVSCGDHKDSVHSESHKFGEYVASDVMKTCERIRVKCLTPKFAYVFSIFDVRTNEIHQFPFIAETIEDAEQRMAETMSGYPAWRDLPFFNNAIYTMQPARIEYYPYQVVQRQSVSGLFALGQGYVFLDKGKGVTEIYSCAKEWMTNHWYISVYNDNHEIYPL